MSNVKEAVANVRKNRAAGGPGPNTTFVSGDTADGEVKTQGDGKTFDRSPSDNADVSDSATVDTD